MDYEYNMSEEISKRQPRKCKVVTKFIHLCIATLFDHLEIVKSLIRAKPDVRIMNHKGDTPLDVAETDEIYEFILQYHLWQRRRPLILTRPHDDHETNKAHKLTALGNIVTATSSGNEPSSHDDILFQIKLKVASFL